MLSKQSIDVHSHLLPAVDDGCMNLAQSLATIRALVAHNYAGAICTPHFGRDVCPANTPDSVPRWVDALQSKLSEEGVAFQLWSGSEVRISSSTIEWFEKVGVPTLGPSRSVLIDYWGRFWPPAGNEVCRYLLDLGYEVILAHPERMELVFDDFDGVLDSLEAMSVKLQGNLNSFAGREGPLAEHRAWKLLEQGRYWILGSDSHGPGDVPSRMAGLARIAERIGNEALETLLCDRPRELVTGSRSIDSSRS